MVLTMFVDMAVVNPTPFVGYAAALKASGEKQPVHLIQVCQIMGAIATINEARLLLLHTEFFQNMSYSAFNR